MRIIETLNANSALGFSRELVRPSVGHDNSRPRIGRVYPVNLSILMTGGKETNQDVLSNGERSGLRLKLEIGAILGSSEL